MTVRKVGVEEELMLVDPETSKLTAVAQRALRAREDGPEESPLELVADVAGPEVEEELFLQQIETTTAPCDNLNELGEQLRRARRAVGMAAVEAGAAAVAVAAPVLVDRETTITPRPRYRHIREEFGELARSSLACAMHTHVDISDDVDGVVVLDRIGPWLPVLLAISANSPYWHGEDTGYASWRHQIWTRWPGNGTGEAFGSRDVYDDTTARLVEWGAALDEGMIYFDARLSRNFPTVEVRVADVCTEVEDTVLLAALTRALVETAATGTPGASPWRGDLRRAASWRASRYGISERLVDPVTFRLAPAREVLESLVSHTREALEEADDLALVQDLVERLISRGNGATRQRRAFERSGDLVAVVRELTSCTENSWTDRGTWVSG